VSTTDNASADWPPDTEADVGVNDHVQWVNLDFEIWDKSGNHIYGPAAANTLWSGFGGVCETGNRANTITRR
jgi:hypothetical protein